MHISFRRPRSLPSTSVRWSLSSGRTKMRLWYFDHPDFDLVQQLPHDERMHWINRLLAGSVREHEGEGTGRSFDISAQGPRELVDVVVDGADVGIGALDAADH